MGGDGGDRPGSGFFGWLGRQVGYVTGAVKVDVEKKAGAAGGATGGEKVVYREEKVQEKPLPGAEGVTLRRRVVDEVVVREEKKGNEAVSE